MSGIPTIGDVVREWRRYHQISLTEFSKRTKLTKGYISELEHNKIDNPKQDKLERMAEPLRISVRDILSRRMPELRRRRGGALASPPIEEPSPMPDSVEATTVGQDIDKELEGLSQEECDMVREFLVPQARQLKRLIKLNRGGGK
jgi:transcriptional regulator with XRE-family HTH domain